jgi:hypothetical protein
MAGAAPFAVSTSARTRWCFSTAIIRVSVAPRAPASAIAIALPIDLSCHNHPGFIRRRCIGSLVDRPDPALRLLC